MHCGNSIELCSLAVLCFISGSSWRSTVRIIHCLVCDPRGYRDLLPESTTAYESFSNCLNIRKLVISVSRWRKCSTLKSVVAIWHKRNGSTSRHILATRRRYALISPTISWSLLHRERSSHTLHSKRGIKGLLIAWKHLGSMKTSRELWLRDKLSENRFILIRNRVSPLMKCIDKEYFPLRLIDLVVTFHYNKWQVTQCVMKLVALFVCQLGVWSTTIKLTMAWRKLILDNPTYHHSSMHR